jgi:hypothetical protein
MQTAVNLWPLIGVAVIIVGFVLRFNPMLIVAVAAIVTALAAHFPPEKILAAIGTGFIKTRNIPVILLLPLAVDRPARTARPARTGANVDRGHPRGHCRTPADRLSAGARTDGGRRPDWPRRSSADGASADRADDRGRRRNPLTASSPTRCATACARSRPPPTTSACFSAKTFSLHSVRSC